MTVNRRVLLIAVAVSLALVGGWYMLLWSPGQSSKKAAADRQATADQQAGETAAKVRTLTAAKKNMPAMQAQLDALRKAVPDTPQLDTVIATIDTAASQSAIDLRSLAPAPIVAPGSATGAPVASSPITELRFTMSANGTYFQLVDFVHRISTTPRLIVVDSFSLTTPSKEGVQSAGISGRMFMINKPSTTATTTPAGAK